jgi:hypothetical protein
MTTTISLRVPLLAAFRLDDDLFASLGGITLRCSALEADGTVELTAEGSTESVTYCRRTVRPAA